jgi:hypothetical protein
MISLDTTSIVKTIIGLGLTFVVLLVWQQQRRLLPIFNANERTTRWLAFVSFRLVPFALVYLVLDQEPRSDVIFFYERAVPAMQGQLVYRDFLSFHGPLFTYLTVLPLFIWNNARVIVLLMATVEFVIANATYQYAQATVAPARIPDAMLRYVLYYVLPMPFVAMVLSSQEDIWMFGFGLLTLALPRSLSPRNAAFLTGIIWGVGMLAIKFMLIVLLVPLFFLIRERWFYLLGLLVVGIPSVLIMYGLVGDKILMPIQHSSYAMAPNAVSVLRPVLGSVFGSVSLTTLNWIGLTATVGTSSWVAWRFRKLGYRRGFVGVFCFVFALFMVLLPSSSGYYLFAQEVALVLLILPNTRTHWLLFAGLNFLMVVQPILMIVYADNAQYTSVSMLTRSPVYALDWGIQVLELAGLIWLVKLIYNNLKLSRSQSD